MDGYEVVDLVDSRDRNVGKATVERCLRDGLRHRAVAVLVLQSDGRILIQVRNKKDHWQPGRWTLSCTGHVKAGESYEHAAKRELKEELGLKSPVAFLTKTFLPEVRSRGEVELEVVSLFTTRTDAPPRIDPVELEGIRFFDSSELKSLVSERRLTPDARIMLREYQQSIRERPGSQQIHQGRPRPAQGKR